MVGDNSQRNVRLFVLFILYSRNLAYLLHDILNGVNLKKIVHALHNDSKSFKSHAGVYVRMLQTVVISVFVLIELCEHQIPHFHESVAVAAEFAVRFSAAVFRSAVYVNFGAGSARTCSMLPKVIFLTHLDNALGGNAYFVYPDILCLVILLVDSYPQILNREVHNLGEELPRPCDCFVLEIISEREVSEHFKISTVARRLADSFYVGRSYALLAGCDALSGWSSRSGEPFFHRRHSRIYQKQAVIVVRYKRKAAES